MTRRLVIATVALVVLLAAGMVQTVLSRTPTADPSITTEGCDGLRQMYAEHHAVWKAGVRLGRDAEVDENLATMRAILHRLEEMPECRG